MVAKTGDGCNKSADAERVLFVCGVDNGNHLSTTLDFVY